MEPHEYPIAKVVRSFYPDWKAPANHYTWNKTSCPFHGDERPSASISYEHNAFNCHACDATGGVVKLIMYGVEQKEGRRIAYEEAQRYAETVLGGRYNPVSPGSTRKRRGRTFGKAGSSNTQHQGKTRRIPPWVCE